MAKITTENLIWKFFEKWKEKRLSKAAKKILKDNPGLESALKKIDDGWAETRKELEKTKK
tara:strand:- start:7373 stop:7552 length:180 start_codon:yes stop_codon:yes gene_type:complete